MAIELWVPEGETAREIGKFAQRVIDEAHPHLAGVPFAWLFRSPAAEKAGRIVLGSTRKATAAERALIAGEAPIFVVTFAFDFWEVMNEAAKVALIDHELSHCRMEPPEEEGDDPRAWLAGHDFEGFAGVKERRGAWWRQIPGFASPESPAERLIAAAHQLTLFPATPMLAAEKVRKAERKLEDPAFLEGLRGGLEADRAEAAARRGVAAGVAGMAPLLRAVP